MNSRELPISPTSASLHPDESSSNSSSHIPCSEPLLEVNLSNSNIANRSKWVDVHPSSLGRTCRRYLRARYHIPEKMVLGRRKNSRLCLKAGFGILLFLGIIQLLGLIGYLATYIFHGSVHRIVKSWGRPGHIGAGLASWPTDFSRDILPIPCHSHNDYWRTVPLYSAIEVGCIGVEADIWLFDEQLYVGHSVASLTPNRTINSLYINPLLTILSKQNPEQKFLEQDNQLNGVFDTAPEQSLIFLIDFKTSGATLWPYVQSALEPLRSRNYLTRSNGTEIFPGPITIVGTGNTPFNLVNSDESNPHHDIFFDAPLADMMNALDTQSAPATSEMIGTPPTGSEHINVSSADNDAVADMPDTNVMLKRSNDGGQGKSGISVDNPDAFGTNNSYYASVAFSEAIGQLQDGQFSEHQMNTLRGQIEGAHRRGLKVRYWDLPFWPISLRNHVWDVLVREGVDMLNVDDLKGATKRNWSKHRGWWKRMRGSSYKVHEDTDENSMIPPS